MLLPHATDIVFQGRTSVISEGPIRHLLLDPVQQALFHEVCSKLKIKYKMSFILETQFKHSEALSSFKRYISIL